MSERNAVADVSAIRKAIDKIRESLLTQGEAADDEESTKWAFILPFLRDVLGYNVENLFEVKPEYSANFGYNKGEKVDIAILNDDSEHTPRILIECKKLNTGLTQEHVAQLRQYFDARPSARFGILTNGQLWQLYTDMDDDNLMDKEPYAVLDVLNPNPEVIGLLQDMTKEGFDSGKAREDAERYHKGRLVYQSVDNVLSNPSTEFVKDLTGELTKYKPSTTIEKEYKPLVMDALKEHFNQRDAEESDDTAAVRTGTGEAEQEQPKRTRQPPFKFSMVGLKPGDVVAFAQDRDKRATVVDDSHVEYEGDTWSLSALAEQLTGRGSLRGPEFFAYEGELLTDRRDRMEASGSTSAPRTSRSSWMR